MKTKVDKLVCFDMGVTGSRIAKDYGIGKTAILSIKSGRTWGWLTGRGKGEVG